MVTPSVGAQDQLRELTETFEQLRQVDRVGAAGKLADVLAHDLGSPLNVILGRANLICSDPSGSKSAKEHAQIIVHQISRVTAIIGEVLGRTRRPEGGRDPVCLREVAADAARLYAPIATARGVEIRVEGDPALNADIERGRMLQVLTHLVLNGLAVTPDGGVLRVCVDRRHVAAPGDRFAMGGDFVCVSVVDTGAGIVPERLDTIFLPYFAPRAPAGGSGIGLSLCQEVVRERGGFIEVDSKPGEGTRLTVYLPDRRDADRDA
jgi:signal transduction histidine kinase